MARYPHPTAHAGPVHLGDQPQHGQAECFRVLGRLDRVVPQFPDDNEAGERLGHMYATDFHRPEMGIGELERLIARPHQPAKEVARWLNAIADIQTKEQGDADAAAVTLQRIVDQFPNAAVADLARSRMHMLPLETRGQKKTAAVPLGEYEQRLGLKKGSNPQRRDDGAGAPERV